MWYDDLVFFSVEIFSYFEFTFADLKLVNMQ